MFVENCQVCAWPRLSLDPFFLLVLVPSASRPLFNTMLHTRDHHELLPNKTLPAWQLPFGTSWQDFKDWLRIDCHVDHVELFQSSTSGWIRLRGQDNFNRAWARLKKEYFRNRAIIASDKNRTESIKIKELVDDSRAATYSSPGHWDLYASESTSPDAMLPRAPSCLEELSSDRELGRLAPSAACPAGPVAVAVTTTPAYGGPPVLGSYATMPEAYNACLDATGNRSLPYAPGFGYYEQQPPADPSPVAATGHFGRGSPFVGPPSVESQYSSLHPSHACLSCRSASGTPSSLSADAHQRRAHTAQEARRVLVTSIQRKARASDVSNWIRHQIGEHSSAITALEIPLLEPKGRIHGYALVTLSNPAAAEAAVRILDQKLFQGRVVSTRPMAGGTQPQPHGPRCSKDPRPPWPARQPSKHDEESKPTRRHNDWKHRKAKSKGSTSPSASAHAQCHNAVSGEDIFSGPVIAYGSSTHRPRNSLELVPET